MKGKCIRVAILDDHPTMIDGYRLRISADPQIEIVATIRYGEDLESMLTHIQVDVLLLDVHVPTSPENSNPYPVLHLIPMLLQRYRYLSILVVSMYSQPALISSILKAGASGYILKDDLELLNNLADCIYRVMNGEIQISEEASKELQKREDWRADKLLTTRQLEALSMSASYPDASTYDLADRMNVAHSTIRNLLSGAYLKLDVRTRAAAIAKARQLGFLPPDTLSLDISKLDKSPE